jgi:hypothetical protein
MAAPKFLQYNPATGRDIEVAAVTTATPNSIPATDANGRLTQAQMPTGVGPELVQLPCSEALVAGDWVSFHDVGGVAKVRKANATDATKPAQGFVKAGFNSGDTVDVYCDGQNAGLTGLTAGTRCFLSAAASGATVTTPPNAAGNLVQCVGVAVNATTVLFKPEAGVVLA